MKKLLGISLFLAVLYFALLQADPAAATLQNHLNLGKRIGFYGVISLGVGLLIITGGIDLSIGSVVCLSATVFVMLIRGEFPGLKGTEVPPWVAVFLTLFVGLAIGLVNGLLVTKMRLQAFVVTLCGLFIYRGLAMWLAGNTSKGLEGRAKDLKALLYKGEFRGLPDGWFPAYVGLPKFLFMLLILSAVAAVFLHLSVYGRYFYAIGGNEKAARYSGIATDRYKILAYVLCSLAAAWTGVLYILEHNTVQPSIDGNFFELYAIAGAVLGGCSLRGGEGSVLGILIGTTILWILPNFTNMWGVPEDLKFTVIGVALLLGAMLDELLRWRSARQ